MHLSFQKHTLRFKQPAGTSRGVYRTRTVWYITARDDEGNWGIGECAPLPDLSCDAMPDEDFEARLAEACRQVECAAVPLSQAAPQHLPELAFLRSFPSILFGIETALLSLAACHTHGNPYHLFDNAFSRGEQGITINGLVWMGTFEEMMARMEEKLAQGFRCIKIKIGAIDWSREISLIRALRERYPKDVVEIRVDANGGFTPEQAPERLAELARYDIHSIEQPIRQGQWEAMARLCRTTPIPIALDEELIGVNSPTDKARLLDTIRPQYIILKPSLHGGISGSAEWISLARERGIGYWVTSALESNVGLNAIAQWTAAAPTHLPQGLGTGQLFVDNYDAIHLEINGQQLWCGTERERAFESDYRDFLTQWFSETPTVSVHTSGSTGAPKPILVEKERMCASARMTLDFLRISPKATALLCMPLRYIAGKMMVVRAFEGHLRLIRQAPSSTPNLKLHSPQSLGSLSENFVEIFFLAVTPMQALSLLRDERQRPYFERIPRIIIGGGSITPELQAALQNCRGEVYSTYGMTETLSHIAMRRLNGPEQSEWYTPLSGVSVSKNTDGCLVIDAPTLCPARLTTHDLCELRPDKTFCILGRSDNIISSGGIKLSLEKLEKQLSPIDVPFMLTYVDDPLFGQALTLLYTSKQQEDSEQKKQDLKQQCSKLVQSHACPRHFLCVPSLPTTETGKPARAEAHKLAQIMLE